MKTNQLTQLDVAILQKWLRLQNNAILVEGFKPEEHTLTINRFLEYMQTRDSSLSLNFLEIIEQDHMTLMERLKGVRNLFVYNMDLFGGGINPDLATQGMKMLRVAKNEGDISQLMFARPNANLDYNSRPGYTYADNHPLGNWCSFYEITDGELVSESSPIQHRN